VSPPESNPRPGGPPYRRPRADIYTVLLLLTLFALLIGILCLYFEMDAYNFEFKGGPTVSAQRSTMVAMAGWHGVPSAAKRLYPITRSLAAIKGWRVQGSGFRVQDFGVTFGSEVLNPQSPIPYPQSLTPVS